MWGFISGLSILLVSAYFYANMFYDDGEGYIDLGLDNIYSFDNGNLVADTERTGCL